MLRLLVKLKSDTGMTLLWADHFIPELLQVVQDVIEIGYRDRANTAGRTLCLKW